MNSPNTAMKYVHTKYLNIGLKDLERRGGKFQRAAKSVYEILGSFVAPHWYPPQW